MSTTYPTKDDNGDPRYYWDDFTLEEARELGYPTDLETGQHAPFGDSTFRVIDTYDGVIAHTNTAAQASVIVQALLANPQPVEVEDKPYSFRQGAKGTGYITRARNLDGRFDIGDAFEAIREATGWEGVVLLSTTYWTNGEETGWRGADEVRWHFQQY